MPIRPGLPHDQARLYADLARDLDAHSRPRAVHGAFAAFRRELGAGRYERYAQFRGRTVQWLRLLRDGHRTFDKRLQKLLEAYGSARVLWAVKLVTAGHVEVDGAALKIVKGPGRGRDLADLTSAEVDRLLAHRPLRARRRPGGPATSGRTFELPRDVEEIAAFLIRRLKTLVPTRTVKVPRFSIKAGQGLPVTTQTRSRSLAALVRLEGLLDLYLNLVRELEGVVLVENPHSVALTGQGRGERRIVGIPLDNVALTQRLADLAGERRRIGPPARRRSTTDEEVVQAQQARSRGSPRRATRRPAASKP